MILQLYRECFILLNHVPCVGCCVYTVSKRRRKEKKRNPHAIFFSDSNSRVEWRAEYWGTITTQLGWRFKEMEGTRNRLLQPPPHRILRVGRRRRKKQKTKQNRNQKYTHVPVLYQLSLGHVPLTSKTFLLLNQEVMVSAVQGHGS